MQARVIGDIESLDQAIRIVKDVESGYHAAIEENISYRWAVDEDIIDSYVKLMNKSGDEKVKSTLSKIIST